MTKREKERKVGKPQEVEKLNQYKHIQSILQGGWLKRCPDYTRKNNFSPQTASPLTSILYMNFYFLFLFSIRYKILISQEYS